MKKTLLFMTLLSLSAVNAFGQMTAPGFSLPRPIIDEDPCEITMPAAYDGNMLRNSQPVPAPVRYALKAEDASTTVSRLVSHREINMTTGEVYRNNKYSYDQYGFMDEVTSLLQDNSSTKYSYEWLVPGKIWSSRTIDGGWYKRVETRSFYDNNNVKEAVEIDSYGGDTISYRYFDPDGFIVKGMDYSQGKVYRIYLSPINSWEYVRDDVEYSIAENNCLITKRYTSSEKTELYMVSYVWYGTATGNNWPPQIAGYTEYYSNGEKVGVSGGYPEFSDDKITIYGFNTTMNDGELEYHQTGLTEISPNWYDERVYEPGRTYWQKYYRQNYETGEFYLAQENIESWISQKVFKQEVHNYDNNYTSIYYTNLSLDYSDPHLYYAYYDENNGNYGFAESNSSIEARLGIPGSVGSTIYTYYDKDDNEISRLMKHDRYKWSRWTGDEWELCSSPITLYQNSGPQVIEFDDQCRMSRVSFADINLGDTHVEYFYTEDGYGYNRYVKDGDDYKPYDAYSYSFKNNVEISESIYWGEPKQGSKTVSDYNTHIRTYYNLNEDGEWEMPEYGGLSALQHIELLDDGLHYQRLNYWIESDGNVVCNRKSIYNIPNNDGYRYTESYRWDAENEEWIGEYKDVDRTDLATGVEFSFNEPIEPWRLYTDEYFVPLQTTYSANSMSGTFCNHESAGYDWNQDSKSWDLRYSSKVNYELTETATGKQFKVTASEYKVYDGNTHNIITIYEANNDGMLCHKHETTSGNWYEDRQLTYDERGRLIRDINEGGYYSGQNCNYYAYADIDISAGISDIVVDATEDINVDGRNITTPAGRDAEVYNLQGVKVADIAAGTCGTLPEGGVYIVRAGSTTVKIAVK